MPTLTVNIAYDAPGGGVTTDPGQLVNIQALTDVVQDVGGVTYTVEPWPIPLTLVDGQGSIALDAGYYWVHRYGQSKLVNLTADARLDQLASIDPLSLDPATPADPAWLARTEAIEATLADVLIEPDYGPPQTITWGAQHLTVADPSWESGYLFYAFKWTPTIDGDVSIWAGRNLAETPGASTTVGAFVYGDTLPGNDPVLGGSDLIGTLVEFLGGFVVPPNTMRPAAPTAIGFDAGHTYTVVIADFEAALGDVVYLDGILHSLNQLGGFTAAQLPPLPPGMPYKLIDRDGETVAIGDVLLDEFTEIAGSGAGSVQLGLGAAAAATASVAIGKDAAVAGALDQGVAIGEGAQVGLPGGTYGIAIGKAAEASGDSGVALGRDATASGSQSVAVGFEAVASAGRSAALVSRAVSDQQGVVILSSSGAGADKIAQTGQRSASYMTTTTSVAVEQLSVPDDSVTHMRIVIIARRQTAAVTKVFDIDVTVEKVNGVARVVGSIVSTVPAADAGSEAWTAVFSLVGNVPRVTLTGAASTVIYWGITDYHEEIRVPGFA